MTKPTRFERPVGPNGETVMSIRIATSSGDVPTVCFGMFNMTVGDIDMMLCLTDNVQGDAMEITEYRSGLRWPVSLGEPSGWALGLTSPCPADNHELIRVTQKAREIIGVDVLTKGVDVVARAIASNQKRYKTNEWDF